MEYPKITNNVEDGCVCISNDVFAQLICRDFTSSELAMVMCVAVGDQEDGVCVQDVVDVMGMSGAAVRTVLAHLFENGLLCRVDEITAEEQVRRERMKTMTEDELMKDAEDADREDEYDEVDPPEKEFARQFRVVFNDDWNMWSIPTRFRMTAIKNALV